MRAWHESARASRAARSRTGSTKSATCVAIAARGMASWPASAGSCTSTRPPRLLDRPHANRAVAAAAREHDGEAVAVLLGERPEEQVDRCPAPARLVERDGRHRAVGDLQATVGRDDVDPVRLERHRIRHLLDRHRRARGEDGGSALRRSGERWTTTTYAMPRFSGNASKNAWSAWMPPAEAPMPAMMGPDDTSTMAPDADVSGRVASEGDDGRPPAVASRSIATSCDLARKASGHSSSRTSSQQSIWPSAHKQANQGQCVSHRIHVGPCQSVGRHCQPALVTAEMSGAFISCRLNVYW